MAAKLTQTTLDFLKDLSNNNDRNWFAEHKNRYEKASDEFKIFLAEVQQEFSKFDDLEKMKVYRIYRDVRFSKDKSPYKNHLSGSFAREGKYKRGGYYFEFLPGATMIGGGFWEPNKDDLKFLRDGIIREEKAYRKLIAGPEVSFFGGVSGDSLKTAPQGFDKEHPAIELIRNKQFLLFKNFDDKTATSADFKDIIVDALCKMKVYFDFMSELLVFDENGIER